jgi:hypothetical protein
MKKTFVPLLAAALTVLSGCGNVDEPAPAAADIITSETSAETTSAAGETTATTTERTTAAPAAPPDVVMTSAEKPTDGKKAELRDISLRASERELTAGEPADVIWSAEIPVDCSPDVVYLIDEDTYETAAELYDIADYANFGGDIMGDSVYNCRFVPDTNIDTDPDVSEQKTSRYFAMFTDDKGTHRSDTFEIAIYEQFTDKELDEMEAVSNAINELRESEDFKALDYEKQYEQMIALLTELSENGTPEFPYPLITPGHIVSDDDHDMITYEHICGISEGIKIKPFDPRLN